jgi:hypothetical protein
MGIFKKENPLAKLVRVSNLRVLWETIDGSELKLLMFPFLMSEKSDQDVTVFELNLEKPTPGFIAFESNFLGQYNSLFEKGRETPRSGEGGDELALSLWPNYTIATDSRPFRVLQDKEYVDRNGDTKAEYFDYKQFGMFVYFDNENPLRLGLLRNFGNRNNLEEFVTLDVPVASDLYFSLWSLCTNDVNIKSTLIVRVKFVAGEQNFRKVLISVPNQSAAFTVSKYFQMSGLKGI